MKLYADRPYRATNQLLGDLLVALWVVVWVAAAVRVRDRVAGLAEPGRDAEAAGHSLARSLRDAAGAVDNVPLAGDALRGPFDRGAGAGRSLAAAARAYQDAVADLALVAGLVVGATPILLVLALWLPGRLAWVRDASAAKRLLRDGRGEPLDLFALRALARQPLPRLSRVAADPAGGWRRRDPAVVEGLARLELDELGLRHTATSG